jgi:uncharacterized protein (UPF0276 family)
VILTLRASHLISKANYREISGIRAHEYHSPQPLLEEALPVLFHSGRGIVEDDFLSYFDTVSTFLSESDAVLFSFDLGPAAEVVHLKDYYYDHRSQVLDKETIKKTVARKLALVKNRYRGVVAVENLNFFPFPAYQHVCEPNFICDIVRDNDIKFVLDVAHAVISGRNLGIPPLDYILGLPLEHVAEIHLSEPAYRDSRWCDSHGPPGPETYAILDSIRSRLHDPVYLVIEYYGEFSRLQESYSELARYAG